MHNFTYIKTCRNVGRHPATENTPVCCISVFRRCVHKWCTSIWSFHYYSNYAPHPHYMFPFAYPDTSPPIYGCFLRQPVSTFTPHSGIRHCTLVHVCTLWWLCEILSSSARLRKQRSRERSSSLLHLHQGSARPRPLWSEWSPTWFSSKCLQSQSPPLLTPWMSSQKKKTSCCGGDSIRVSKREHIRIS